MSRAEKAALMAIRITDGLVNAAVLIVVMLLIAYGSYGIWDSAAVTEAGTARQYEQYKPTPDGGPSFQELQIINPETVGWLQVYGTNIDYPVMRSDNNWKYINYNALCEYSLTGSIFMDYHNSPDFSDFNTILFGHNMTPRVMFGNIKDFKNRDFFDRHPYGDLFYGGKHHGLEFFAIVSVDAYDFEIYSPRIVGAEAQQNYLDKLLAISTYKRDIGVSTKDRLLLLSTCSNEATNERDILVGRITDTTFNNKFADEAAERIKNITGIDVYGLEDVWNSLPLWVWLSIAMILIATLVFLIHKGVRRRRERKMKNG
jgi:sortase B